MVLKLQGVAIMIYIDFRRFKYQVYTVHNICNVKAIVVFVIPSCRGIGSPYSCRTGSAQTSTKKKQVRHPVFIQLNSMSIKSNIGVPDFSWT